MRTEINVNVLELLGDIEYSGNDRKALEITTHDHNSVGIRYKNGKSGLLSN